jgi:uncharacterized protein
MIQKHKTLNKMQPCRRTKVAISKAMRCSRTLLRLVLVRCFVLPVLAYQYLIAPLITDCCRWHPCCSKYAQEAITKHGPAKGVWLCVRRLARCHPWSGSGYDPVP